MTIFTKTQDDLVARLSAMRDEAAEIKLTDQDCPLLTAQLDELMTFSQAVIRLASKLRASQRDAQ